MSEEDGRIGAGTSARPGAKVEREGEGLRVTFQLDTVERWSAIVSDVVGSRTCSAPRDSGSRQLAEAFNSTLAPESPVRFAAVFLENSRRERTQVKDALALLGCAMALLVLAMTVSRGVVAWWADIFG